MSDYGFAFAMLPLAFLAVICTASGLRSAYVCRVPGDASVWFEGTAVLLACDLLLDCLDMRAAAVHIAVRGLHPLLLIQALGLAFAGLCICAGERCARSSRAAASRRLHCSLRQLC